MSISSGCGFVPFGVLRIEQGGRVENAESRPVAGSNFLLSAGSPVSLSRAMDLLGLLPLVVVAEPSYLLAFPLW